MRDMESLLQDLRAEGLAQNRKGNVGLGSLLFDAYNRLITLSPEIERANHGGGPYTPVADRLTEEVMAERRNDALDQVLEDHVRYGSGE